MDKLNKNPNLNALKNTFKNIKKYIRKKLIVVESSTYPGSTKELAKYFNKKLIVGKDFYLGYSPEREDPGNKKYNLFNTPKLVSGATAECLKLTNELYKIIVKKTVIVENIETAEFTKIYENAYRSVNIAFANEGKLICKKLGININNVIRAASTKPFGFYSFLPGPGVGGHCIPVDTKYLTWIAKKNNINANLMRSSLKINSEMPKWIINNLEKYAKKIKKEIRFMKILILGATYKKNSNDLRESPFLEICKLLKNKKAIFKYNDDNVKTIISSKLNFVLKSVKVNKKNIKDSDAVLLLTDHDYYKNYSKLLLNNSKIIFDTRNFFKKLNRKIINT